MTILEAKQALDKIISKGRVHLYKPIQIAEILYRDRIEGDINLSDLDTYRNASKRWRDVICLRFLEEHPHRRQDIKMMYLTKMPCPFGS